MRIRTQTFAILANTSFNVPDLELLFPPELLRRAQVTREGKLKVFFYAFVDLFMPGFLGFRFFG